MQLKANGIFLEVEVLGPKDGQPLILIRGLGSQLVHWPKSLISGFNACGFRTVVFDNRDVGLSQRCPKAGADADRGTILSTIKAGETPRTAYSLDDMARDVIGLMEALEIDAAHVLGISMGGAIAQILAIKFPSRLLSATFIMTAAGLRGAGLLERLLVEEQDRAASEDAWVQGHASWGCPGFPMSESEIRAQARLAWDRGNVIGNQAAGINRQAVATFAAPDRRTALRDIALPCLVIHGANDTLIPQEAGREIASLIPNAGLEVIDGMGHAITPALSPMIVKIVEGFIRRRATLA